MVEFSTHIYINFGLLGVFNGRFETNINNLPDRYFQTSNVFVIFERKKVFMFFKKMSSLHAYKIRGNTGII